MLRLDIDEKAVAALGVKRRTVQRAIRASLEAMGRLWHDKFLYLHFEETAYRRYGYKARSGERAILDNWRTRQMYYRRKLREMKHARPLVYTGQGMIEALGPVRLRYRAGEARVVLPSKFNFRNPHSNINMREELTKILPSEAAELYRFGRAEFARVTNT